jgi:hypothetical protein
LRDGWESLVFFWLVVVDDAVGESFLEAIKIIFEISHHHSHHLDLICCELTIDDPLKSVQAVIEGPNRVVGCTGWAKTAILPIADTFVERPNQFVDEGLAFLRADILCIKLIHQFSYAQKEVDCRACIMGGDGLGVTFSKKLLVINMGVGF